MVCPLIKINKRYKRVKRRLQESVGDEADLLTASHGLTYLLDVEAWI